MRCHKTEKLITSWLLGDLPANTSAEVEEHVNSCEHCQGCVDEIEPTLDLMRNALAVSFDTPKRLDDEHRKAVFAPKKQAKTTALSAGSRIFLQAAALVLLSVSLTIMLQTLNAPRGKAAGGRFELAMSENMRDSYEFTAPLCTKACPDKSSFNMEEESEGLELNASFKKKLILLPVDSPDPIFKGTPRPETPPAHQPLPKQMSVVGSLDVNAPGEELLTVTPFVNTEICADEDGDGVAHVAGRAGVATVSGDNKERAQKPAPCFGRDKIADYYQRLTPLGGIQRATEKMDFSASEYAMNDDEKDMSAYHYNDSGFLSDVNGALSKRPEASRPRKVIGNGAGSSYSGDRRESISESKRLNVKNGKPVESLNEAWEGSAGLMLPRKAARKSGLGGENLVPNGEPSPLNDKKGIKLLKMTDKLEDADIPIIVAPPIPGQSKHEGESRPAKSASERNVNLEKKTKKNAHFKTSQIKRKRIATQEDIDDDETKEHETHARAYGVNPFIETTANAFSTFAIDCDTASYTLARHYLLRGERPPPDTVRTEEFVNFFDYHYPAPHSQTFAVYTECAQSPYGRGLHLLNIGVKGRRLGRDQRRASVLTFVIDTSGSMNTPDRIGLVRTALRKLLGQLSERDQVGIVTYGPSAHLLLEHTAVINKDTILTAIDRLQISGSTHLEKGLVLAYQQAARHFVSGAMNRVILLSDGRANMGSDDAVQMLAQIEQYRKQGIFCSVFGFGTGSYNDEILETLADKGDGIYRFIDSEEEVDRVFVKELDATLQTIARDAKIQVEFNPKRVKRYRQIGYENRRLRKQDFRNDSVDAGEVGSGQSVTALYELELTDDIAEPIGMVRVRAFDTLANRVEEISAPITTLGMPKRFEDASARFRLAAIVAELAEILRGSQFAAGSRLDNVLSKTRPLAQELYLDQRVQELQRIIHAAGSTE